MRKIIDFIVEQELETIDEYPSLAEPISEKFSIDIGTAEAIMNIVIDWECLKHGDSLEKILNKKFPSLATI